MSNYQNASSTFREMFRHDDWARDLLLDRDAICTRLLSRAPIEDLLERHRSRSFDHTRQIFSLLSIELWSQRFLA